MLAAKRRQTFFRRLHILVGGRIVQKRQYLSACTVGSWPREPLDFGIASIAPGSLTSSGQAAGAYHHRTVSVSGYPDEGDKPRFSSSISKKDSLVPRRISQDAHPGEHFPKPGHCAAQFFFSHVYL